MREAVFKFFCCLQKSHAICFHIHGMIFDVTLTKLWGIHCVRVREFFFIFNSMIGSDALTLNNEHLNIPKQSLLPVDVVAA